MPFAGTSEAAREAIEALSELDAQPGDELILVDNAGVVSAGDVPPEITVINASGEHSPAYARNIGAARARNDWILFLDADTHPLPGLLGAFWTAELAENVGAVAGQIVPARGRATLSARYGAARSFLSQETHREHPYRPRAAAANLLVRRAAFEELGGFYEGVRAAEDTDFTWRLQEAGWHLEWQSQARVEHRYRSRLRDLRRQWRGYAAGRAWLARRYEGFVPEPALRRGVRRAAARLRNRRRAVDPAARGGGRDRSRRPGPRRFLALDALLGLEELAGFTLSNRPPAPRRRSAAAVVLVADRFPARGDPLVELAESLDRVRVEAVARPATPEPSAARRLMIDYLEDDGYLYRFGALLLLALRHPLRCLLDAARRGSEEPPLRLLAPAVRRLQRDPEARLQVLGAGRVRALAERLARLAGRRLH
jgi:GT2 family glycosyltransferase